MRQSFNEFESLVLRSPQNLVLRIFVYFLQISLFIILGVFHRLAWDETDRLGKGTDIEMVLNITTWPSYTEVEVEFFFNQIKTYIHAPGFYLSFLGAVFILIFGQVPYVTFSRNIKFMILLRLLNLKLIVRLLSGFMVAVTIIISIALLTLGTVTFLLYVHLVDCGDNTDGFCGWSLWISLALIVLPLALTAISLYLMVKLQDIIIMRSAMVDHYWRDKRDVSLDTGTCYTVPMMQYCRWIFRRIKVVNSVSVGTQTS